MLKIVIGTNEGKVLCISNNEDEIKASMVNYLIDTDQEPTEDFFESRNWGEYDIEVYEYHQPQLNKIQKNKTDHNLLKINDLAFELQHDDELTAEQYWKVKKIFELSVQYQLNENQQVVLGYLKEMMISFDLCNAIYRLESAEDWGHASEPYDIAYESLNDKERLQVVQAACQWAQEWEEPV